MSFLFYATNLLMLVSFVVFVRQVVRAPDGHEDELGFHVDVPVRVGDAHSTGSARRTKVRSAYAKASPRHLAA